MSRLLLGAVTAVIITLTGCSKTSWIIPPGGSEQELRRDSYECQRDAAMLAPAPRPAPPPSTGFVHPSEGYTRLLRDAKASAPDLLVLDLLMPTQGGLEVLMVLRSRSATAALPVLVLTALDDEGHTRAGFELGATDYLTKPFSIPQLAARVRACLSRREANIKAEVSRDTPCAEPQLTNYRRGRPSRAACAIVLRIGRLPERARARKGSLKGRLGRLSAAKEP